MIAPVLAVIIRAIPDWLNLPPGVVLPAAVIVLVFVTGILITVVKPVLRTWAKSMGDDDRDHLASDMAARLDRIERAVDAMSEQVERIGEVQRHALRSPERPDARRVGPGA